ncbi:unnamed protein product [Arctogadus glacialis]
MEIFKAKRGLTGQVLADLMQPTTDVDVEEGSYNEVPEGILCHEQEHISPHMQSLHQHASSVGIILEGNIVMDVESLPHAMYIVFGRTHALHLNSPKYMKNTFDFFQQVLLNLGKTVLKPKR